MPADKSFIFNVDLEPTADPPVVFFTMRAPCACGRPLAECAYTFFPGSVFIHGTCQECGPQTAIFAPHMREAGEPLPAAIARTMARLTADLARTHGEDPRVVMEAFLTYLAEASAA